MSEITNNDGYNITLLKKQIKTIEQFKKEAQINEDEWEVKKGKVNKWDVNMKIKTGKGEVPVLRENWQVSLQLEKLLHVPDINKFKEDLISDIKKHSVHVPRVNKTSIPQSGNMLEINIPDLHMGKIGIKELSDKRRWGTLKSFKDFQKTISYFINFIETSNIKIEKILFVVGNDINNTDTSNPFPQTTAGTPQSQDEYGPLIFRYVNYLLVESIYRLYQLVPNITIKVVRGNHDNAKAFYMGEFLDALFYENENIEVDNSLNPRVYEKWGINLLGFTHGNHKNEGLKRLSYLMQSEVPLNWSKTKIREWHLGDIHHVKKVEILPEEDVQGINFRYFRSLMIGDPWELKQGYVSNKGADAIIWNKLKGKLLEIPYNNF